jgi:hypothetical protein
MTDSPMMGPTGPGTLDEPRLYELLPGIHGWVQPDGSWWVNNAGAGGRADDVLVTVGLIEARRPRSDRGGSELSLRLLRVGPSPTAARPPRRRHS